MTVCMGYPAMTSQERAEKRRRKGAGKPCRENGIPKFEITLTRKTGTSSSDFTFEFTSKSSKTGTTSS